MTEPARKRILIVDDANLVQLYYRNALARAGFEVDGALNGIEALEKVLIRPVDLLIIDVNMPQMDGLTFLRSLRRQPLPLGATPALVTSTESAPADFAAARAAGANFYLVKPVSPDELLQYAQMLCGAAQ